MKVSEIISQLQVMEESLTGNASPADQVMSELWRLAVHVPDQTVQELMRHPDALRLSAILRPHWAAYIVRNEWQQLSCSNDRGSSVLAIENYQKLDDELAPVRAMNAGEVFVMAGCGPYPETLLRARDLASERIITVGLDQSREAIVAAASIAPEANFILVNAMDFDYAGAKVVLLANALSGKPAVLARAGQTMSTDSTLLVRAPLGFASLLYEDPLEKGLPLSLSIVNTVQPSLLSQTIVMKVRSNGNSEPIR
jgi:hypothetical protein